MAGPDSSAEVLRRTSRTFALSIQLLPRAMRTPVRVAYLLARIADTISDTGASPPRARRALLAAFREAVAGAGPGHDPDLSAAASGRGGGGPTARAEAALLGGASRWLEEARRLPAPDRADVRAVVDRLIATMDGELALLEACGPGEVASLADARALTAYTEGIAGCVGAFWTSLVARHAARIDGRQRAALDIAARRYGRALQLVNVLRDAGPDLGRGLCLLPADELARAGLSPGGLAAAAADPGRRDDARARLAPVARPWARRSRLGLLGGLAYAARLRGVGWRTRVATALPAALGLATLARLPDDPAWLDPGAKVSIGRRGLRRTTALTALACLSRSGPRRLGRIGRRNTGAGGA